MHTWCKACIWAESLCHAVHDMQKLYDAWWQALQLAEPAKWPYHVVVWEHVCDGQMTTWRQQSLLKTVESLRESSVRKIRRSGCFEPAFRTSAVGAMQSVPIRQDLFLVGSQMPYFVCLLRFQHLHGDHGEVPSPGITFRGSMLQLVH